MAPVKEIYSQRFLVSVPPSDQVRVALGPQRRPDRSDAERGQHDLEGAIRPFHRLRFHLFQRTLV